MATEAEAELSGCQAVEVLEGIESGGRCDVEGMGEGIGQVQAPHSQHSGVLSCGPKEG